MNRFLKALLPLLAWGMAVAAPSPVYRNTGTNPDPIVIDATVFENTGDFNIGSGSFSTGFFNGFQTFGGFGDPVVPFETQNTLVFSNSFNARMTAVPGFNLMFIDDFGIRRPAASIYNERGGRIQAEFANLTAALGFANPDQPLYGGIMTLSATNIVNRGTISGFYAGTIQIQGEDVDLAGSRLGNQPLLFSTFNVGFQGTFYPETDVRDNWWAYGNGPVNPTSLAVETARPTGTNLIVNTGGFGIYRNLTTSTSPDDPKTGRASLSLRNPAAFVFTNQPSATNKFIEVVFVDNSDTNVVVDVSWDNGPNQGYSKIAFVRFTTIQPDLLTPGQTSIPLQFIIEDTFAADPQTWLLNNTLSQNSQAPTNIFAFRAFPPAFTPGTPIGGFATNSPFSPTLFTTWFDAVLTNGVLMTNVVTTNLYATWAAQLEQFPSTILNGGGNLGIPGASLTNVAGRVAIDAKSLNLKNASIQGQGLVSIRTDNLKSSRGAVIDAPILNYDLGTTNGLLVVKDLAKASVSRFGGAFGVWSTTFTNLQTLPGTNTDGSDATNLVATYHVTVIQNSFTTGGRSFLNDLRLRSAEVQIEDAIEVDGRFSSTAQTLRIGGVLQLVSDPNLVATNVPNLQVLENVGSLFVPNNIGLGLSQGAWLNRFSNSGLVNAAAINVNATQFDNSGFLQTSSGNTQVSAVEFNSNGGVFDTRNSLIINATNAKLDGIDARSGGTFDLYVSGNISDGGTNFPGVIAPAFGINLRQKPPTGDLLGTTVSLTTPDFETVESSWAAQDLGATLNGYTNNAALGVLSLETGASGVIIISPVQAVNAMYVHRLDLGANIVVDLENSLDLEEGMTLYFNTTSTNVTPAQLDGFVTVGGGTLRWVPDGSQEATVTVRLADGRTLRIPRSQRFSTTLDSDGDGIFNADDSSPFDAVVVSKVTLNKLASTLHIEWKGGAGQSYEVQGTSDLRANKWTTVTSVKNATAIASDMSVDVPIESGLSLQAFRVIVLP